MPGLLFSPWIEWSQRDRYPQVNCPGVYAISITDNLNLLGESVRWDDVVYIGMTNARGGLRSRWKQFDNSIVGGYGHSGGIRVRKEVGSNYGTPEWTARVYVAALPIECNIGNPNAQDYIAMGQVAYLEYQALSEFFKEKKDLPLFNKKGRGRVTGVRIEL